ncbi:Receptor-like serine/threonine-protein kinase SD1-8 [Carex littledalei]|uniref:non-specific serine/threonine protein kinase n=1 Tax=Carex littledalei TaxID=544730 RepID=A0A833VFS5_9POAL|nr:Receptor-like serine/threonine-protein kinase SD1-8 [Carex littledalei]
MKTQLHKQLIIALFLFASSPLAWSMDTLLPGQNITTGRSLISSNNTFELGFFRPGSSPDLFIGIWFSASPETVVWVANRDSPLNNSMGILTIHSNGSLVLYDSLERVVWSSSTNLTSITNDIRPLLQLNDSGNLVLKDQTSNTIVWQSFDHPTNSLIAGMKLGKNLTTGFETVLSSWKSSSDPSEGKYMYKMDTEGAPEIIVWDRDQIRFRTGMWNGLYFSETLQMLTYSDMFTFLFVQDKDEVSYGFEAKSTSILSRIFLNDAGIMQRLVWDPDQQNWNEFWSGPKDECDYYGKCGAFGICQPNTMTICSCLRGFEAATQTEWNMRDYSGGCKRRTPVGCTGNSDGFYALKGVKLPYSHNATVDTNISVEECRTRCLMNCSCLAYSPSDIRGKGSGCVMWNTALVDIKDVNGGLDILHVKVSKSELGTSNKRKLAIIIGTITSIVISVLIICLFGYLLKRKKMRSAKQDKTEKSLAQNDSFKGTDLPLFDMETILQATDNFSITNEVGQGGFGIVYKAWKFWEEENILKLLDEAVESSVLTTELSRCIHVGLLCVQECPNDRPSMSSVFMMLSSDNVELPAPKKPLICRSIGVFATDSNFYEYDSISVDQLTITKPPLKKISIHPPTIKKMWNKTSFKQFVTVLLLFSLLLVSYSLDTTDKTKKLVNDQTLVSSQDQFVLGFFNRGTPAKWYVGIWYNVTPDIVVWIANRDYPLNDSSSTLAVSDRAIVLIDSSQNTKPLFPFSSSVDKAFDPIMQLLDSGNLVIKGPNRDEILWQSFDYPSNTMLPGIKIGKNLTSGFEWYISSWKSSNDPSTGNYHYKMDTLGLPEIVLWNDDRIEFKSGAWDGLRFSGLPEMATYSTKMVTFNFISTTDEISYSFEADLGAPLLRVVLNETGVLQRMIWYQTSKTWIEFWSWPTDLCDDYRTCGPFGICNVNEHPICDCLPGFKAKSPSEWSMRNTSGGCERKTPLSYRANSNGFQLVKSVKLPDTESATVDASISIKECKHRCLANRSCLAYSLFNISGAGSGCITWDKDLVDIRYVENGQDLYIKLDKSDLAATGKKKIQLIIGMIGTSTALISVIVLLIYLRQRKKNIGVAHLGLTKTNYKDSGSLRNTELPIYDLETVMAWQLWQEGRITNLVDEAIESSTCVASEIARFVHVGLLCVQECADDRPTMSTVVSMLSNEGCSLPEPKKPVLSTKITPEGLYSANELTVTGLEGR